MLAGALGLNWSVPHPCLRWPDCHGDAQPAAHDDAARAVASERSAGCQRARAHHAMPGLRGEFVVPDDLTNAVGGDGDAVALPRRAQPGRRAPSPSGGTVRGGSPHAHQIPQTVTGQLWGAASARDAADIEDASRRRKVGIQQQVIRRAGLPYDRRRAAGAGRDRWLQAWSRQRHKSRLVPTVGGRDHRGARVVAAGVRPLRRHEHRAARVDGHVRAIPVRIRAGRSGWCAIDPQAHSRQPGASPSRTHREE